MGSLAGSGLPIPDSADLLGTAIGAIAAHAPLNDVLGLLAKQAFITLTPVGPLVAPIELAGNLVASLLGQGQTLPVHAYLLDPNLPQPYTVGLFKHYAAQVDQQVQRQALAELGRPQEYIDAVLSASIGDVQIPATFGFAGGEIAIRAYAVETWKQAVGHQVKSGWGLGPASTKLSWQVTQEQLDTAGLDASAASLYAQEVKRLQPYRDWATGIDARYRDGGGEGLGKLLADPAWKARSIYWRLYFDLATAGEPSDELLALVAVASEAAYTPQEQAAAGIVPPAAVVPPPEPAAAPGGLEEGPPDVFIPPPNPPGSSVLGALPDSGAGAAAPVQQPGVPDLAGAAPAPLHPAVPIAAAAAAILALLL